VARRPWRGFHGQRHQIFAFQMVYVPLAQAANMVSSMVSVEVIRYAPAPVSL
jgi:hypothetical protein